MKNSFYLLLIAIGIYSCSGSEKNNAADSSAQNNGTKKEALDTADARLAHDLSVFCTTQIKAGKLAGTKAVTKKVKDFGKQNTELYTRMSTDLNRISESYDIKLPVENVVPTGSYTDLNAIKGASFDHAYLLQMLKQHNAMIREYNAAKNIQCMPLKMFVVSNQSAIIRQAYATSALKEQTP